MIDVLGVVNPITAIGTATNNVPTTIAFQALDAFLPTHTPAIVGKKIVMIVRGICCLIPGIKGCTENIKVVSIVGRFLEHSRIYRFGTKEREKVYIASADFMTRNTIRRVEVATPVLDKRLKERLIWMFETMMNDDEKGKRLTEEGIYVDRNLNAVRLNSQELFYAIAYSNAEKQQARNDAFSAKAVGITE